MSGFTCLELDPPVILEILNIIERRNVTIVFDPQDAIKIIEDELLIRILRLTRLLSLNEGEKSVLDKRLDVLGVAQILDTISVIVRMGEGGARAYVDGAIYESPAFTITPKNLLGAGDCFNGALIFGLINHFAIDDMLLFGNLLASIKVENLGTGSGMPTRDEVRSLLKRKNQVKLLNYL